MELDVGGTLDFREDWEERLGERVTHDADLQVATAIDYFVFNKMLWKEIPAFTIGRFAWDHWLVASALNQAGAAVVDLTRV